MARMTPAYILSTEVSLFIVNLWVDPEVTPRNIQLATLLISGNSSFYGGNVHAAEHRQRVLEAGRGTSVPKTLRDHNYN